MTKNPTKVVLLFATLLGAWVVAFWAYQPRVTSLTFAEPAAATGVEDAPVISVGEVPEPVGGGAGTAKVAEPEEPRVVVTTVQSGMRMVAPEFQTYTVQRGDTSFEAISRRVYGTSRHGEAISRANPMASPHKLRMGQTLRIPKDPKNIQGKLEPVEVRVETPVRREPVKTGGLPGIGQPVDPVTGLALGPAPARTGPTAVPAERSAASERVHLVRSGETLSDISKAYYGTANKWKLILDANPTVLTRAERIKPGMELVIPGL